MRPNALKTILRLRKLDRDAAQRCFADARLLEDATTEARIQAERALIDEMLCAGQTDETTTPRLAMMDWLPIGRVNIETQRQAEATASTSAYQAREHLIGHQVGLAAVEIIEATRRIALQERLHKAEMAMIHEASLRRS